jgi:hypothetical protein
MPCTAMSPNNDTDMLHSIGHSCRRAVIGWVPRPLEMASLAVTPPPSLEVPPSACPRFSKRTRPLHAGWGTVHDRHLAAHQTRLPVGYLESRWAMRLV